MDKSPHGEILLYWHMESIVQLLCAFSYWTLRDLVIQLCFSGVAKNHTLSIMCNIQNGLTFLVEEDLGTFLPHTASWLQEDSVHKASLVS